MALTNDNALCVFCEQEEESLQHLLYNCNISIPVWSKCYQWVGVQMAYHEDPQKNFMQHFLQGENDKLNLCRKVSWFATVWSIWLLRNAIIFNNESVDVEKISEMAKLRSWRWLSAKVKSFSSSWLT